MAEHLQKDGIKSVQSVHGHVRIERAHCIFSSPWFISQTKTVMLEKETFFPVTAALMDELVKKEEDQFQHHCVTESMKKYSVMTVFFSRKK